MFEALFEELCKDSRIPRRVWTAVLREPQFKRMCEDYIRTPSESKGKALLLIAKCATRAYHANKPERYDKAFEKRIPLLVWIMCMLADRGGLTRQQIFEIASTQTPTCAPESLEREYNRYLPRLIEYLQRPENMMWYHVLQSVCYLGWERAWPYLFELFENGTADLPLTAQEKMLDEPSWIDSVFDNAQKAAGLRLVPELPPVKEALRYAEKKRKGVKTLLTKENRNGLPVTEQAASVDSRH